MFDAADEEVARYRALSSLAVAGLLAGLLSPLAMFASVLWLLPLAAVVLSGAGAVADRDPLAGTGRASRGPGRAAAGRGIPRCRAGRRSGLSLFSPPAGPAVRRDLDRCRPPWGGLQGPSPDGRSRSSACRWRTSWPTSTSTARDLAAAAEGVRQGAGDADPLRPGAGRGDPLLRDGRRGPPGCFRRRAANLRRDLPGRSRSSRNHSSSRCSCNAPSTPAAAGRAGPWFASMAAFALQDGDTCVGSEWWAMEVDRVRLKVGGGCFGR